MGQARLKAAFCRGGTSKAVLFNGADLPADRALRDRIFLQVLGSPDPYGRQLDGMGGGISSLSKVVIVEPCARADAEVEYTFVQVGVDEPVADYGAMCGNMSSAVGAFAVAEKIVKVPEGVSETTVRIHNTNTDKVLHATFPVSGGEAVEHGDFEIPGVAGTGAKIRLDFLSPGGAATGHLLPSGNVMDTLVVEGAGSFDVSLVDASNPLIFVRAGDVGCSAQEMPVDLDADRALMHRLESIRRVAAVKMGQATSPRAAGLSNPKVALIAAPAEFQALDGRRYGAQAFDLSVRLVSMGNFHRAITLTGAMCVAVAAGIPGTLVHEIAAADGEFRIGNPSGVLPVRADVRRDSTGFNVISTTTFRTQRRIMDGHVLFPAHNTGNGAVQ